MRPPQSARGRALLATVILVGLVLAACGQDKANQVRLAPTRDTTLYQDNQGFSNGSGSHLFAGATGQGSPRRALIAFGVAGRIPAGSRIVSVKLTLNVSRTQAVGQPVELRRALADWGEATSRAPANEGGGAEAAPGDATWLHRLFDASAWATPGGDFAPQASATSFLGGEGRYTWGSTPQMVADVQAWLDNPATDFGWLLLGNEATAQSAKRFDSRENPVEANRPALIVRFTAPGQ